MVCADAYFAEHGEKIAEQGAEFAVVVAAWHLEDMGDRRRRRGSV